MDNCRLPAKAPVTLVPGKQATEDSGKEDLHQRGSVQKQAGEFRKDMSPCSPTAGNYKWLRETVQRRSTVMPGTRNAGCSIVPAAGAWHQRELMHYQRLSCAQNTADWYSSAAHLCSLSPSVAKRTSCIISV